MSHMNESASHATTLNRRTLLLGTLATGVSMVSSAQTVIPTQQAGAVPAIPQISKNTVYVDGVRVFYREAGTKGKPVLLLLHGFPTSSLQYSELMLLLADRYHVIAPDLPGFGFTVVPAEKNYKYTFDNLANTIDAFTDRLKLDKFALYVFDYGAPTGFRIAMKNPEKITAIITQNGNAYEEGLGDSWAPIQKYWSDPSEANRKALRPALTEEGIEEQYVNMYVPNVERVKPEHYTLDAALIARPGNADIQLDLFLDYRSNVKLYPQFQQYFREKQPKTLAVWGRFDPWFIPAGAKAFARDNPNAEIKFVDAGHFALETNVVEVAGHVRAFLG